ncbi:MAG: hypothetical protein JXL97_18245 [Bacteroidales bacterium]|nr:hypothetical protein [Bacteroidales bacterium]
MKKILLILLFVLPLSIIGYSQVDDSDAQMFGSRRPVNLYTSFDFGKITSAVKHDFTVKNETPSEMVILSFDIPDGFGIMLYDKIISANTNGTFAITIDPKYVDIKGDFEKKIIITTEQEDVLGKKRKEIIYTVKGSL